MVFGPIIFYSSLSIRIFRLYYSNRASFFQPDLKELTRFYSLGSGIVEFLMFSFFFSAFCKKPCKNFCSIGYGGKAFRPYFFKVWRLCVGKCSQEQVLSAFFLPHSVTSLLPKCSGTLSIIWRSAKVGTFAPFEPMHKI